MPPAEPPPLEVAESVLMLLALAVAAVAGVEFLLLEDELTLPPPPDDLSRLELMFRGDPALTAETGVDAADWPPDL
jgi:hypothetical protein